MLRILIGGILGGILIFVAGAIIHVATPLGHLGIDTLPNDQAVQKVLKEGGPANDGFYFFPSRDLSKSYTAEEEAAFMARYTSEPAGIIIYHPKGGAAMGPKTLGGELVSNIVIAMLAAFIISLSSASFGQRVMVVTLLGVIAWVSVSISNWNWYGFPGRYIAAEGIEQVVEFLLCGILLAFIFKSHRQTS